MKKGELQEILRLHGLWLAGNDEGMRANLSDTDLRGADLRWTNLRWTNLSEADLSEADLSEVNLRGADLRGADLRGADLDYAAWPLWCGSLNVKIDERLARQILYHAFAAASEFCQPTNKQLVFINQFHRIPEVPALEVKKGAPK